MSVIDWNSVELSSWFYCAAKEVPPGRTIANLIGITDIFFDIKDLKVCYVVAQSTNEKIKTGLKFYKCNNVTTSHIIQIRHGLNASACIYREELLKWKKLPGNFVCYPYIKPLSWRVPITGSVTGNHHSISVKHGLKFEGKKVRQLDIYKFNKVMVLKLPTQTFGTGITGFSYPLLVKGKSKDELRFTKVDENQKVQRYVFRGNPSAICLLNTTLCEIIKDNILRHLMHCTSDGDKKNYRQIYEEQNVKIDKEEEELKSNYINDDCSITQGNDIGNNLNNKYVNDDCSIIQGNDIGNNLNNNYVNNKNSQYMNINCHNLNDKYMYYYSNSYLNEKYINNNNNNSYQNNLNNNNNNSNYLNLKHWKEEDYEVLDKLEICIKNVYDDVWQFECKKEVYPHQILYCYNNKKVHSFSYEEQKELDEHRVYVNVAPFCDYYFKKVLSYLIFQINYHEGRKFYYLYRSKVMAAMEATFRMVFKVMTLTTEYVQREFGSFLSEHSYDRSRDNINLFREWTGFQIYENVATSAKEQLVIIMTRFLSQSYCWPNFKVITGKIVSYNIGRRCGAVLVSERVRNEGGRTYRFFPTDLVVDELPAIPVIGQEVYGVVVAGLQKVKMNNTDEISMYKKNKLFKWLTAQISNLSPNNPRYKKFEKVLDDWYKKDYVSACEDFHNVFGNSMRLPSNKVDEDARLEVRSKLTCITLSGLRPVKVNAKLGQNHPNCSQRKRFKLIGSW